MTFRTKILSLLKYAALPKFRERFADKRRQNQDNSQELEEFSHDLFLVV